MIPIIDIKSNSKIKEAKKAFTDLGFAIFVNHFSQEQNDLLKDWFLLTKMFFSLPEKTKIKYMLKDSNINVGYDKFKLENVNISAPGDLKESFNLSSNYQMLEKLWPVEIKNFKKIGTLFEKSAHKLSMKILSIFEDILSLPKNFLIDKHLNTLSTLRVIHYPEYNKPIEKNQLRIGEHTDYGTFTILWQLNDISGLEIKNKNENWIKIPYVRNSIIVNVGDLLQRWSNDFLKSTPHRVNNSNINFSRYSMPYFVHPAKGTLIKNLRNEINKYEPILSEKYLEWRLSQSYQSKD